MNNSLLKSVVALVLFYGSAAVLWLWLLPPAGLIDLLKGLPEFMQPADIPDPKTLNALELAPVQKLFFNAWSAQILKAWGIAIVSGVTLTLAVIFLFLRHRRLRARSSGSWRTLGVTLGPLPVPEELKRIKMAVKLKGVKLSKEESALLEEILGTLKAHPDAYVGAGHGEVTLYDHTMSVVAKVMDLPDIGADHILCAAAHDMGKITSFVKGPDGSWDRTKMHAQESARILAILPAWGRLPVDQREAIRLAVKNEHSPNMVPGIDSSVPPADIDPTVRKSMSSDFKHPLYDRQDFRRRVMDLIASLREADGQVTAAEKKVVLATIDDLPKFCLEAFLKTLPNMPFYAKGVPPGFKGMVWQQQRKKEKKNRLYISEAKMRDFVMAQSLSQEHHAALGGTYRGPKTIAPFTWYLLQAFKERGWLVTKTLCYTKFHKVGEEDGPLPVEMSCKPEMPLWDVLSGTMILNGVIIIELDETVDADIIARCPNKELGFPIGAARPHQPNHREPQAPKNKGSSDVKLIDMSDLRKDKEEHEAAPLKAKASSKAALADAASERKEPTLPAAGGDQEDGVPDLVLEPESVKHPKVDDAEEQPVSERAVPEASAAPSPADDADREVTGSSVESSPTAEPPPPAPPAPKPKAAPQQPPPAAAPKPKQPTQQQGGAPKHKNKPKQQGPKDDDDDSGKVDFSDLLNMR